MAANLPDTQMASTLRENIAELAKRRRRDAAHAPLPDRVADRISCFAGSMPFVYLHAGIYGLWVAANLGAVPGVTPFDPTFVVLATMASVEAIFLSTFILISQNRMAAAADKRADLDLHITLLTEHELTKLAQLVDRIAARLEVPVGDPEYKEIEENVDPAAVLDALEETQAESRT